MPFRRIYSKPDQALATFPAEDLATGRSIVPIYAGLASGAIVASADANVVGTGKLSPTAFYSEPVYTRVTVGKMLK